MSKKQKFAVWTLDALALVLFIATFTPLVMPENQIQPKLAGIPYTMWMGFLVSLVFVAMAYLMSKTRKE